MPGFRRRSVSPEHAPDREGLPLARETFLLLRGPDRACEGTAGSGGPHSWHLAARVSRERIAPGRSSVRLTSRHRTSERTGLTRRRSRKSPDPKGGTPPCPVAGPPTDMCWPGRHAWNVVCADDFSHPRRRLRRPTAATRRHELTRAKAIQALRELDRAGHSRDVRRRYPGSRDFQVVALYPARHQRPDPPAADETDGAGSAGTVPAAQRATDASLRARLTAALDRNRQLADENARLRRQLARALGDQRSSRTRSGNDPEG